MPCRPFVPDTGDAHSKILVDRLHAMAKAFGLNTHLGELLSDAAVDIDSYRAGLHVVTPHRLTGWRLARTKDHGPALHHDQQAAA